MTCLFVHNLLWFDVFLFFLLSARLLSLRVFSFFLVFIFRLISNALLFSNENVVSGSSSSSLTCGFFCCHFDKKVFYSLCYFSMFLTIIFHQGRARVYGIIMVAAVTAAVRWFGCCCCCYFHFHSGGSLCHFSIHAFIHPFIHSSIQSVFPVGLSFHRANAQQIFT